MCKIAAVNTQVALDMAVPDDVAGPPSPIPEAVPETGITWDQIASQTCSIARTLELVGERWTMLVVRDVRQGIRRFDDLQRHLGIARNVLSQRLTGLVAIGILDKVPYREPGKRVRHEYHLTERGENLLPILLALMDWGDRYLTGEDGAPLLAEHADCGAGLRLVPVCGRGHIISAPDAIGWRPGPGARPA